MKETDLYRFVAREDEGMRRFEKPFVWKGWRYGTNGRVLVKIPALVEPDCTETDADGGRVPKSLETTLPPVSGEWSAWPTVDPCDMCDGIGYVQCDGCECGFCEGEGDVECEDCHRYEGGVQIAGVRIARHYAAQIATLPGVEYLNDPQKCGTGQMVRFRFADGGEGGVMEIKEKP